MLLDVIELVMNKKISNFSKRIPSMPSKCPVYMHLPWLGSINDKFAKQISSVVKNCYLSANMHVFSLPGLLGVCLKGRSISPSY